MIIRKSLFALGLVLIGTTLVSAQWEDKGQLDSWSSRTISRLGHIGDDIYLTSIRAGRDKGFERIVFEFRNGVPPFQVEFAKGPIFETTGEQRIRVKGNYFLSVIFQGLPYPENEKDPATDVRMPKRTAGMSIINELKEIEWFEGTREIVIGMTSKPAFRVLQLSKPYRIVVDVRK